MYIYVYALRIVIINKINVAKLEQTLQARR